MSISQKWYRACLDVLFPPVCVVCGASVIGGSLLLCGPCKAEVQYIQSPHCTCCGKEFPKSGGKDHLCGQCLQKTPSFFGARAIALYSPPVSVLLQRLKYNYDSTCLQILSELAKRFDLTFFEDCECVFPVPLHRKRLQARGFNQSLLLARLFFPEIPSRIVPDMLIKTSETLPQTDLEGAERRVNLRFAFSLKEQLYVRDKKVCVVDDVLTTGATVEECSKTLLMAGAKQVKVLTMARVSGKYPR